MISNPNTLNGGESILTKQNGKLHENDEEEEDDHQDHMDQINSLKKKLAETGLVSSLKRSPSEHDTVAEAKKIKSDETEAEPCKKRQALIRLRQLENKLRNEETKYVLLKRLYYSQKTNAHRTLNGQAKAPLVGQRPVPSKAPINKTVPSKPNQSVTRPPTTPVQNSASATSLSKQHMNRMNNNNSPLIKNPSPSPSSAFSPIAEPVKKPNAQTHAIVNQLVRKEFEKSLNQLEFPPKNAALTPAQQQQIFQDIYFLPNANSPDFLMCLGLEEVVKCVQEHLNNKQQYKEQKEKKEQNLDVNDDKEKTWSQIEIRYEYPYMCAQCSTDWTPVWRTDRNGVVLCEKCLKQIEKRQIKQEQMARLKQLFSKAQKDKEMFEKQVLSEQSNVTKPATPKQMPPQSQNRPVHQSTPVNANQKFAPTSRPSPIQSQGRPSPVGVSKTPNSVPSRPAQPNQNLRNAQTASVKTSSGKEQQRQRSSTGGPVNFAQNSVKSNASTSSSNLNNLSSQFNFQNLPHAVAIAALAQQQQQQHQHQQAALFQLLQNQTQNNLFNLPNISPSTATLNYLNMLSSSAANLNGKQWKNS